MKSSCKSLDSLSYLPLETLPRQAFRSKLQNIWQNLRQYFNTSSELQVWQKCDRLGNIQWSAYNPKNGQSVEQLSEEQMRIWIEQNYRQ